MRLYTARSQIPFSIEAPLPINKDGRCRGGTLSAHLPLLLPHAIAPLLLLLAAWLLRCIVAPLLHRTSMGRSCRLTKNGQLINAGKETTTAAPKGKCMSSTATGGQLECHATGGYLPPPNAAFPHSPVIMADNDDVLAEALPKPKPREIVSFISFVIRDLGFPIHPFLNGTAFLLPPTPPSSPKLDFEHSLIHHPLRGFPVHRTSLRPLKEVFQVKLQINMDETCECGRVAIYKKTGS